MGMDTIASIISLDISPARLRWIASDMEAQLEETDRACYSIIGDNGAVNLTYEHAQVFPMNPPVATEPTKRRYITIAGKSLFDLESRVEPYIRDGFIPDGGICVEPGGWFRSASYYQTLTYGVYS